MTDFDVDKAIRFDTAILVDVYLKGLSGGFRDLIVQMAIEAHRALKAQCVRSTTILAAEVVHRANCELILQELREARQITYNRTPKKSILIDLTNDPVDDILDTLTFNDTIILLYERALIDDQIALHMHALRHLRNQVIHKDFPVLHYYDPPSMLTDDEFRELLQRKRELQPRQFAFFMTIAGQKVQYVADPLQLDIDLSYPSAEKRMAVISLRLMLLCLQQVVSKFAKQNIDES